LRERLKASSTLNPSENTMHPQDSIDEALAQADRARSEAL